MYFDGVPSPSVTGVETEYKEGWLLTTGLTAVTPPGNPGLHLIQVGLKGGRLTPQDIGALFQYCKGSCSGPGIESISPSSATAGGGTKITITGHDLNDVTDVRFGNVSARWDCQGGSASPTSLTVTVPATATTGRVALTVETYAGSATAPFEYLPRLPPAHAVHDRRGRFPISNVPGLNFLPSWLSSVLNGIFGRVVPHPAVYDLFWDRSWDADAPGKSQATINSEMRTLTNSGYLNAASQYGVGYPSFAGGSVAAPGLVCPKSDATGGIGVLTVEYWITCEAGGSLLALSEFPGSGGIEGLPLPDGLSMANDNTVYEIFLPPNSSVGLGGYRSCGDFASYHFFTAVFQVRLGWGWGFLPYPDPVLQTVPYAVVPTGCGGLTANPSDGLMENASHELLEAATDPLFGLGWISDGLNPFTLAHDGEASDVCEKDANNSVQLAGLPLSTYWSNSDGACVPKPVEGCHRVSTSSRLSSTTIRPIETEENGGSRTGKRAGAHAAATGELQDLLKPLRKVRTFRATATVTVPAHGAATTTSAGRVAATPAVYSHFSIEKHRGRVRMTGTTKHGAGAARHFDMFQVGGTRCVRAGRRWRCRANFPAVDPLSLLATYLPVMPTGHSRIIHQPDSALTVRTETAGVEYSTAVHRTPSGLPRSMNLAVHSPTVTGAHETITFGYRA